jgi:hypothetical protein
MHIERLLIQPTLLVVALAPGVSHRRAYGTGSPLGKAVCHARSGRAAIPLIVIRQCAVARRVVAP